MNRDRKFLKQAADMLRNGSKADQEEMARIIDLELATPDTPKYRIEQSLDFIENSLREEIAELQGKYDDLLLKYTNELRHSHNLQLDIEDLKSQLSK